MGIRLVDVPADLVEDPRARQYIIDSLKPGVTVKRRIEVSNKSDDVLHVAVCPGAADIRRVPSSALPEAPVTSSPPGSSPVG
ncbi:hypothetical protein ACFZDJ_05685 [Streptomyces sp. NPDC007896]|uniref:hypothetical protein n=1 Tax=Streptomyces sp. NPDC007896 TaxID=3364784 RepID=UPI0036EC04B6